jgi:ABC-2 type transport system permease protein
MGLAFFISFCWRFLVNLTAFWTPNALGVGRFAFTISLFLSGMLMPLRLLPDWFNALCHLTPFPSMMNTVTEVYLGLLSGPDLLRALAWQAAWAVILAAACAGMLRAGLRRLVVQGG